MGTRAGCRRVPSADGAPAVSGMGSAVEIDPSVAMRPVDDDSSTDDRALVPPPQIERSTQRVKGAGAGENGLRAGQLKSGIIEGDHYHLAIIFQQEQGLAQAVKQGNCMGRIA